jgi:hypothetical protein
MQVKNEKHTMVKQSFISNFPLLLTNIDKKESKNGVVK